MDDTILTLIELEDFFQNITTRMLGFDDTLAENQGKVRISFNTDGLPPPIITDNLTYIRVFSVDDPVTRFVEKSKTSKNETLANKIVKYYRVHEVSWAFYGSNSFDNADLIRSLFLDSTNDYHAELINKNLGLILDVPAPIRIPELIQGKWWSRTDLKIRFNEQVTRISDVPYLQSANIIIKTDTGKTEEINITENSTDYLPVV